MLKSYKCIGLGWESQLEMGWKSLKSPHLWVPLLIRLYNWVLYKTWHTFFSVWYVVYEQIGQQKSQTQKKIEHKNSDFGLARKVQLTKDKKNIPLISRLPFCSLSSIQRCQCSPVLVQKQERQCPKEGSGCLPWKILFSTILNKYFTSVFHISCPTFSKCLMYA